MNYPVASRTKDADILKRLGDLVAYEIPNFQLRYKNDSYLMRFIGFFLKAINPNFMKTTTTTLYPVVYFPNQSWVSETPGRGWQILAHEYVHLWDRKHIGRSFTWRYLTPQIAALGSLMALMSFWSLWFLLALVLLVALAPWPSPYRRDVELRGYTMTMALEYWLTGDISDVTLEQVADKFNGWSYYRMEPSELVITFKLSHIEAAIRSNAILIGQEGIPFRQVHDLLKQTFPIKVA